MAKFVMAPHMRLHEWVAEEKGYFEAEGLEYEFQDQLTSKIEAHNIFPEGQMGHENYAESVVSLAAE